MKQSGALHRIQEAYSFRTQGIKQQKTVIPETEGQISVSLNNRPAYSLERGPRPQSRKVERRQSLVFALSLEDRADGLGRPRQFKFTDKAQESCRERKIQRSVEGPLRYSPGY